jgi:hypothetical protein
MPNISENPNYQHLVKATLQAKSDRTAFDPRSFEATTTAQSTSRPTQSYEWQSYDSDVEEESGIIDERGFSVSLKRGTQAAKLARPESAAIVKKQKGGQNVQYNMVSRFISKNADGT